MELRKENITYLQQKYELTEQEIRIIEFLVAGIEPTRYLANLLNTSQGKVRKLLSNIYQKFEIYSRMGVAIKTINICGAMNNE